jgi:hypothetical protein
MPSRVWYVVHSVIGTATNVSDVMQAHGPLHGQESNVLADQATRT